MMEIILFVLAITLIVCFACFLMMIMNIETTADSAFPIMILFIGILLLGAVAFDKAMTYGERKAHRLIAAGTPSYELVSNPDGSRTWEKVKVKR